MVLDRKYVGRSDLTVGQWGTCFHEVAILHQDLAAQWHQVFTHHTVFGFHNDLAVTAFDGTECHHTSISQTMAGLLGLRASKVP